MKTNHQLTLILLKYHTRNDLELEPNQSLFQFESIHNSLTLFHGHRMELMVSMNQVNPTRDQSTVMDPGMDQDMVDDLLTDPLIPMISKTLTMFLLIMITHPFLAEDMLQVVDPNPRPHMTLMKVSVSTPSSFQRENPEILISSFYLFLTSSFALQILFSAFQSTIEGVQSSHEDQLPHPNPSFPFTTHRFNPL